MNHVLLAAAGACLLGSFYFTIAACVLMNFSHARLDAMDLSERRRRLIDAHLDNRVDLVLSAGVMKVLCNILFVMVLGIGMKLQAGAEGRVAFFEVLLLSLVGLIFLTELMPRAYFRQRPERYLGRFLSPVSVASQVLSPLLAATMAATRLVGRVVGAPDPETSEPEIEDEILSVVASGEKDGEIEEDQKEMFENVVEFRDADVAEVMTPRTEMVSIEDDCTLHDAIELAMSHGHSRIPVYRNNRDNVIGVFYLRDVMKYWGKPGADEIALADVLREPVYVPETKQIAELLGEMRQRKFQIAIVVDEYGGTSGLITTEDIVEEIVGEIQDEYDRDLTEEIVHVSEDCIEADGRAHVDKVNEALRISLPEEDTYDTIGGFVFAILGHVPQKDERLEYGDVEIIVMHTDERRIHRVKIIAHREDGGASGQ